MSSLDLVNTALNYILHITKNKNKLRLSCAKLRPAWASYQLAFVWLAFTEAAYYA